MKAYEQLAVISNGELTKVKAQRAFKAWCKATGYTEEEGDKALFNTPERIGIALLKRHEKES